MMQTRTLKPLLELRILITRPKEVAGGFSEKLRVLGATPIELPTIEIAPPADFAALDKAIRDINSYDWIVFTSVHGVKFFTKRLTALGLAWKAIGKVKIAAVGPATASILERNGRRADYVPKEFLTQRIAEELGDVKGKRMLLPRTNIASKMLPDLLRRRGALVEEVIAYRTLVPPDLSKDRIRSVFKRGVDFVAFTSPSAVRNLAQVLGENELAAVLKGTKVACIGPVTGEAVRELGVNADVVAMAHTIDALVEGIVNETRTL
jgi:uroporphyrinogen III methyltransferase/synthase